VAPSNIDFVVGPGDDALDVLDFGLFRNGRIASGLAESDDVGLRPTLLTFGAFWRVVDHNGSHGWPPLLHDDPRTDR
jgi:hypothetical protein